MPIKIPEDVEQNLKRKYPEIDIKTFINSLFQEILDKVFRDGACPISGLGKFIAFVTYSSRINSNVVRFKFRPAAPLIKRIKRDQYLLEKLPVKANVPFTEQHEEKCKDKREIKNINLEAQIQINKVVRERTKENLVYNRILDIVEEKTPTSTSTGKKKTSELLNNKIDEILSREKII